MLIVSKPNAGKNMFFDAVVHWYSNYGQVCNFNKYQQFPLMDCVNRRILIWNECLSSSEFMETLKLLFSGDSMKVKVKYLGDAVIDRTPIILLTNTDIFPKDEAFKSRMFRYTWQPFPDLKHVQRKVNPHAYIELLKKYNIINAKGECIYNETFTPSDYDYTDTE